MSTVPKPGPDEHPSDDEHASDEDPYDLIRWITSDSRRTYRVAVLLLITLGAVVAIAAFLSTAVATCLSAIIATGALYRIAKRQP